MINEHDLAQSLAAELPADYRQHAGALAKVLVLYIEKDPSDAEALLASTELRHALQALIGLKLNTIEGVNLTFRECHNSGNRVTIHGDHHGPITNNVFHAPVKYNFHISVPLPLARAWPTPEATVEGKALISQMPCADTDPLPERAGFPLSERLGQTPLPHFVGRSKDLRLLAAKLKPEGAPPVVITGMPGIGKTSIAVEFAYRYGRFFSGGVFWISCAAPEHIDTKVGSYAETLELVLPNELISLENRVNLIRKYWRTEIPQLLILDNCDDWILNSYISATEEIISDWVPEFGGCRVLITSRRQTWDELGLRSSKLSTLESLDSETFLIQKAPRLTPAEAGEVADELGRLPLALNLAGNYLNVFEKVQVTDFINSLRKQNPLTHDAMKGYGTRSQLMQRFTHLKKYSEEKALASEAERDVYRVFGLSLSHLRDRSGDRVAINLLARAALLAPGEPFEDDLLLASSINACGPTTEVASEGRNLLLDLGLIDRQGDDFLQMHRLLAAFAHIAAPDPSAQDDVEEAVIKHADRVNEQESPNEMLQLLPHLSLAAERSKQPVKHHTAPLLRNLGRYYYQQSSFALAEDHLQAACASLEQLPEPDELEQARCWAMLGNIARDLRQRDKALYWYEKAQAMYKRAPSPRKHEMLQMENAMGALLHEGGACSEAHAIFLGMLETRETLYAGRELVYDEQEALAESHNNVASTFREMGDWEGAYGHLKRALEYMKLAQKKRTESRPVRGKPQPTGVFVGQLHLSLAIVTLEKESLQEEELMAAKCDALRALRIFNHALDRNHLMRAEAQIILAEVEHHLGAIARRDIRMKRAEEIYQEHYDKDLARVREMVEHKDILSIARSIKSAESLSPERENLLRQHDYFARFLNARGVFAYERAAFEEAASDYFLAYQILRVSLGDKNRQTLDATYNLGRCLRDSVDHKLIRAPGG